MPKSCYLLLLVFGLLLSGCGGGSGGSAFGETPAITQEQSQALEEVRLKAGDVPGFTRQPCGSFYQGGQSKGRECQFFQQKEEWTGTTQKFTVSYIAYNSAAEAQSILNSSMEHHPLKPKPDRLEGLAIWQLKHNDNYQIYLVADKVIINVSGSDLDLLKRAVKKMADKNGQ